MDKSTTLALEQTVPYCGHTESKTWRVRLTSVCFRLLIPNVYVSGQELCTQNENVVNSDEVETHVEPRHNVDDYQQCANFDLQAYSFYSTRRQIFCAE